MHHGGYYTSFYVFSFFLKGLLLRLSLHCAVPFLNGLHHCATELSTAPERVQSFFGELNPDWMERVIVTPEALQLAETYVNEKVVGETSIDDCIHIATATLNKVDILVSWNFRHIVNVYRIRGYNAINLKMGFQNLNIHSPKEIVGYEK